LIYCEGRETEPNYFHALKREDHVARNYDITIKRGKGGSRVDIVTKLLSHVQSVNKEYDHRYCVLDTEHLRSEEEREDFSTAMALAAQKNVTCFVSNPCFEVWLLAHFERTCQCFPDCDSVIQRINKYWKVQFKREYAKNDELIYLKLRGQTRSAINRARQVREIDHKGETEVVECNSSTERYRLIEKLLGPEP
jgi:hypothetical protein